ncbi:unnamed protein product [Darwinula stevensoni]|uniref:Rhodanese domain-containing protein n=1 Tax=Darwinula stevensoni TaxID=69355 RepID=A0A7R9A8W3_9CRUS|nr:unnamed protein product [Darwinula stevensoni]CAG0896814.1 unnamed protein product [Darwinula stevensoni]
MATRITHVFSEPWSHSNVVRGIWRRIRPQFRHEVSLRPVFAPESRHVFVQTRGISSLGTPRPGKFGRVRVSSVWTKGNPSQILLARVQDPLTIMGQICTSKKSTQDADRVTHPKPTISHVTYEDVKGLVEKHEGVIIDVRDRDEVQQEGKIPSSYLLPLAEISDLFELDPGAFEKIHGYPKPSMKEANLIVHCSDGKKGGQAAQKLSANGFQPKIYAGFENWCHNGGPVEQFLTLEQIRQQINKAKGLILDVRNWDEIARDGKLPTTRCLPLKEMDAAFKMDPEAFKKEYVFPKPLLNQEDLVVHCYKGIQASAAAAKLFTLGYKPKTYSGYAEWKENEQPVEKWLSFEEVKEAIEKEKGVIIDVRNHKEIQRDGKFPTTKIVPLPEMKEAFQLDPDDFQKKYAFPMPPKNQEGLVFYCRKGMRATEAAGDLYLLGYRPSVYTGYVEWVERGGPLQQWVLFENIKEQVDSGTGLIIDVRDHDAIIKDGKIPTAKIVPRLTRQGKVAEVYGKATEKSLNANKEKKIIMKKLQGKGQKEEKIWAGLWDRRSRKEDNVKTMGWEGEALPEIQEAFQLDPEAFQKKYVFPLPSKTDSDLVVHCKLGLRASQAAGILYLLGYRPKIYSGMQDWVEKGGPVERWVTFEEMQERVSKQTGRTIDVRNTNELQTDGKIPTTDNVPLPEMKEAFEMEPSAFEEKYGFPKPGKDEDLVLHCKLGLRASKGAGILYHLGYHTRVYSGIVEWKERGGPIEKTEE